MVSGTPLFFGLFNNLAIFIVLIATYSILISHFKTLPRYGQQAVLGIFFGLFAIICMFARIPVAEGVIVDQRNAVVALSGAFGGPLAALLCALMAGANRIYLGGAGAFAGVVGVCLAAVAGIGLHKFLGPKDSVYKGAIGTLVATIIILPGFLLYVDLPTGWALLKSVAVPYGIAIFLGMFLGGVLLVREDRRHQAESAKKIATERLRDFAESASDWFWEIDQNLRFTFVSDRFERVTGYRVSDIIGKQRWEITDEEQATDIWPPHQADLLARRPFKDFEYPLKLSDGRTVYCNVSGVPIFAGDGNFTGYRGSSKDISERRQMEQTLINNDRIKGEFIAVASHELRTPLAVILGYAELLLENDRLSLEERRQYLAQIVDKSLILERIVNELLDISRIEAGRTVDLERTSVNIFDVVTQLLQQFHNESRRCHFTLMFPNEQLEVFADRGKLVQVLENLIGNAVKFSPQGGEVTIGGDAMDGHYRVLVADEGIGISAEQQESIFEKFYRVDSSNTAAQGLGIGLYLSRNIIKAHRGKIWVESSPGEGSRFFFTLPL